MQLIVRPTRTPPVRDLEVEVVERKGRGHPDSICDAVAEEFSRGLCRFYLEHAGTILHHNVDKALLFAGVAEPAFGGGRVVSPMRLYLAGRATLECGSTTVPVETIAREATTGWVRANLRALDPERHMEVQPLIHAGSRELAGLFLRERRSGLPLANDTSIGVGFAPLTDLETVVAGVEEALNASDAHDAMPELGEDIKVLGIRRGGRIALTVACAFLGGSLPNLHAYLDARERVRLLALGIAQGLTSHEVSVEINTADDPARGSVYLTVTGTSAEAGDDGQAGRGNRANGLITPYRPMTLESAAGKNPVSHVGKLYQVAAQRIAVALARQVGGVVGAECCLASRIGHPVDDPQVVDVALEMEDGSPPESARSGVEDVVGRELVRLRHGWREAVPQGDSSGASTA